MGKSERDITAHIPRLRRYARALTGDRAKADDLVQDTLERALNKFHLWRADSNLSAWLFTIMHNVYVNQIRAQAHGVISASDEEAVAVPVRATQSDWLEVEDLQAALMHLPDEQRALLLLIGLEQMTYAQAAEVLGIPIGTVMSRLSRARERLRALLEGSTHGVLKVVK